MPKPNVLVIAALFLVPQVALADPIFGSDDAKKDGSAESDAPRLLGMRPGFGARVGGYGFRHADGSSDKWDDCRMNGVGVFGTLAPNRWFFGSLGLDFYNADPSAIDEGMDRDPTHVTAGVGARMFPSFVLTPYVELGGGMEWTRIDLAGRRTEGIFPVGYLGLGAELNVTRELKLGAALRVLATAQPDAEATTRQALTSGTAAADGTGAVATRASTAMQAQFFARYAL